MEQINAFVVLDKENLKDAFLNSTDRFEYENDPEFEKIHKKMKEIFFDLLDFSSIEKFAIMKAPTAIIDGQPLVAKSRGFKCEVVGGASRQIQEEEIGKLMVQAAEEFNKENRRRKPKILALYTITLLRSVRLSDDPNDPIVTLLHPETFKPYEGRGRCVFGLKVRYASIPE